MSESTEGWVEDRENDDVEEDVVVSNGSTREPGSLASRIERRAKELESARSEKFPVPNWDDMLAVELRLVSWDALRKIVAKHERQRVPALQELYTAADQILAGTEAFYEIDPETNEYTQVEQNWISLAKATGKALPDSLTPRQAMIALVGDTNILILWKDWQDWMATRRPEVGDEAKEDFTTTQ